MHNVQAENGSWLFTLIWECMQTSICNFISYIHSAIPLSCIIGFELPYKALNKKKVSKVSFHGKKWISFDIEKKVAEEK